MSQINVETEDVLERIDDAFFALDEEWRFTYLNEQAETVLNVDREAVIGEVLWEMFDQVVGTRFQREYEQAMETLEPASFEEYYPPLDAWFEVNAYPSETGLSVYFQDVTERVHRQRELERYESIVETARDGIYVVDDGTFEMVNDTYAEMVGYDREALVGSDVTMVVDEETAARATEIEERLKSGQDPTVTVEATIERAGGETLEAEATFSMLPDGSRVGVVRDVTVRKRRERRPELYERVIDTIDDGVYAVDDDGDFLMVNDAFCEMVGHGRAELLGESATMLYDGSRREEILARSDAVEAGEQEVATIELDLQTSDGGTVPVETRFIPFPHESGTGRCGVARDISDRLEREAELRSRVQQQAVVSNLGRDALETDDIDSLIAEAARRVAETLDADYCKVLDLDEDDEELLLRQGVGWDDGVVGEATVSAVEDDSQAAYTLANEGPVVVSDLATETRFSGPDLLTDHDVRSGVSTVLGPFEDPWGILGVHDTSVREFSERDVTFVESVSNVLAAAIRRHEDETELRRQRDRLAALNDIDSLVHGLSESMFGLSSKAEIEEMVCDRLAASDSYEFAWVGTVAESDESVHLRTEAGVDGYLDDIDLPIDEAPSELGPTARAHLTGDMQVVQDVETDPRYGPWRDHAAEMGYQSSASIPIVDGGDPQGTLNVYSGRPDAFGKEERDALRRLGSIIAHAMSAVERDRQLERERNRLEFMNRLLRHNLLNSLNVVEARLELLDGRVDFEVSEHLDTAAERTHEMIEFVQTVRDVTRVVGSGDDQELEPRSLSAVLRDRVETARASYPRATFDLASPPAVDVRADDLLGEVFENILVNAVQHHDGESPTVWVDAETDGDTVEVTIADDGPGIPDQEKTSVFDRESKSFEDPGSGFGLYLVAEIMDSYGGTISVEDSDDGGARFCLTFQRA